MKSIRLERIVLGGSFGFLLSLFFALPTYARECLPKSYRDLLNCALETSSVIELSQKQQESAQRLKGVASRLINPELEGETLQKSSDKSETTASLLFTLELGGKRGARKSEALAEFERTKASTDLNKSQAKLSYILKLYRLSHLKRERAIEEESVATFTKIVSQYQRRPARNPEQEVSLSVFKMAVSDNQIRLGRLKSEEEKILLELITTTQLTREQILSNLPQRKSDWPELRDIPTTDSAPQIRLATAELLSAQSLHAKAEGESWPDLKIGPTIKLQKDSGTQETFVGLSASLPLPVFSLNRSGRAYGQAKVTEAQYQLESAKRQTKGERGQLVNSYREAVTSLKAALSSKEVEEKHGQLEKLFFKGLVPSSLVIEAHRQLFELEERRNEAEQTALQSLGSTYIIDNSFAEVTL